MSLDIDTKPDTQLIQLPKRLIQAIVERLKKRKLGCGCSWQFPTIRLQQIKKIDG
jgi:hypothetical protein